MIILIVQQQQSDPPSKDIVHYNMPEVIILGISMPEVIIDSSKSFLLYQV